MTDAPADVVVVGYGSALHRDDAVGRCVAEEIERRSPPGVTVASVTQLLPELVELFAPSALVVFVDASVDVDDVTVHPIAAAEWRPGSHHASPSGLLGLAAELGLPDPPAVLVEVPVADLSLGEGLTAAAAEAVDRAVAAVIDLIEHRSAGSGRG